MGRAASVLSTPRALGFIALAVVVGIYYGTHQWWFDLPSVWWDLAWLCFLLIPAVFGLVWFALPLWPAPLKQLLVPALACGVAAVVLQWADAGVVANFAKLAGMTFAAWCFLRFFEELSWVVLVAVIVPFVDSYSVWRGPTNTIVNEKPEVFSALSFTFPVPGAPGGAMLGLPDLLFFALFLGAAARWRLRTGWTWVCLVAGLGGTMVLATWLDVGGLPALPLLSVGFLLPNADLLWREVRRALQQAQNGRAALPAVASQSEDWRQSLDAGTAGYVRDVGNRLQGALGRKLVGVYIHGSAVLGDFVRGQSDIDMVAVSDGPLTAAEARHLAEALSARSLPWPAGGLELHVVDRHTFEKLDDPPPFELHLSSAVPDGADRVVVDGQEGDPDLVMHYAVLREHGVALSGPAASAVFPAVSKARLVRAFAGELRWALEHASPSYQVLNACRAWRYSEESVLGSKLEGAEWARGRVEDPSTIDAAIRHRRRETDDQPDPMTSRDLVEAVLDRLAQRTPSA